MQDDAMSSSILGSIVSLCLRLGTIALGLVAVVGGLLYVKQDNLLVRVQSLLL